MALPGRTRWVIRIDDHMSGLKEASVEGIHHSGVQMVVALQRESDLEELLRRTSMTTSRRYCKACYG